MQPHQRRVALFGLLVLLSCQNMAIHLMNLPLNRVIELRYCQDYYLEHDPSAIPPDGNVPEELCKGDWVQQRLARLTGMVEALHVVCDITVTIPLSYLADKYSHRLVMCLNMLGLSLMYSWLVFVGKTGRLLPEKAMLMGPFFTLLGGSTCVIGSMVASIVTKIAPDQIHRTSYFGYTGSVSYVITLLGPAIAGMTMTMNLWLPFWIGISLLVFGMPFVLLLPSHKKQPSRFPFRNGESSPILERTSSESKRIKDTMTVEPKDYRSIIVSEFRKVPKLIFGRRNFQLLLLALLFAQLASASTTILVVYIAKRYGWRYAETGYLLSAKASVNVTLLTILVPAAVHWLSSRRSALSIDFLGAHASLLISVFGTILIAIAPNIYVLIFALIIYALGSALPVFSMSLVQAPSITGRSVTATAGIEASERDSENDTGAKDYSILMLAKTTGSLIGVPLMTIAWAEGIAFGGLGLGLPYFASAVFYFLGFLVLRQVQARCSLVEHGGIGIRGAAGAAAG
ncbi:MFS general substrate transporter [Aulographum hederae CBS 113979]|uniref:MFS general substrate transporter n=1 Tax=Aulographum hederae CBS 113979 TaxID=1176131 RepID=A0A6G1H2Z1_9PEZI|nr:MFS general substrate transporter [Aulographum hederae CBS 113979]